MSLTQQEPIGVLIEDKEIRIMQLEVEERRKEELFSKQIEVAIASLKKVM